MAESTIKNIPPIRKILVPVDGSDGAVQAAITAAELAKPLGASVTLITVYDATHTSITDFMSGSHHEVTEGEAHDSSADLKRAEEALQKLGGSPKTVSLVGNPVVEIVGYATQHDVDLIVIGSRGRSLVKAALLGSVSSQTIHQAPCAVLVVRSKPPPPGDTASAGL